jgi:putative sigma-54 modulation protein
MNPDSNLPAPIDERIIISGIRLDLTAALKQAVANKVGKLFRHEPRIVRVRVYIEEDTSRAVDSRFVAKGHIEIGGPDIVAEAAADNGYKSIDEMVSRLDRGLRKRATALESRRKQTAPAPTSDI